MNFPHKKYLAATLIRGCIINGSSVLIKSDVFSSIGLFDENLRYAHDYEMWLRLLPHYEFYYLHEDLVNYRVHDNMGSKKHQKEINQEVQLIQNMYLQVFNGLINEVTEAFNEEVYTATSNLINTLGLDMNELKLTEFRKSAAELGRKYNFTFDELIQLYQSRKSNKSEVKEQTGIIKLLS